jgi:hypothetical protein
MTMAVTAVMAIWMSFIVDMFYIASRIFCVYVPMRGVEFKMLKTRLMNLMGISHRQCRLHSHQHQQHIGQPFLCHQFKPNPISRGEIQQLLVVQVTYYTLTLLGKCSAFFFILAFSIEK